MVQCLERCGFDKNKDQLYFLGDVVDGWSETKESIELLLSIPNLIYLLGNHDQWALEYFSSWADTLNPEDQDSLQGWLSQGGLATVKSYGAEQGLPEKHLQFLLNAKPYFITNDNILLVHAGFNPETPIRYTNIDYLIWSRNFINQHYQAYKKSIKGFFSKSVPTISQYKEIYLGHTPTIRFDEDQEKPLQMGNVILMDTGAAFTGRLSIMDMDSKEVWQSDPVMILYPDERGRNFVSWKELKMGQKM